MDYNRALGIIHRLFKGDADLYSLAELIAYLQSQRQALAQLQGGYITQEVVLGDGGGFQVTVRQGDGK